MNEKKTKNKLWKCCINEPSVTGKKVLCHRKGDIYVAIRIREYYIPMPFSDHYFSKDLCKPDLWCDINFPKNLTGEIKMMPQGLSSKIITLAQYEIDYPDEFNELANAMISSIGFIKKPEGIKLE